MIAVNSVEAAVYTLVASNAVAVSSGFHVFLHEPLNTDPDLTPWIGVVTPRVRIEPWHAQVGNPWKASYELQVFVQDGSFDNAERAFDNALRTLDVVLDALNADRTLRGTVQHVTGWQVTPYEHSVVEEDNFATYLIEITVEKFV